MDQRVVDGTTIKFNNSLKYQFSIFVRMHKILCAGLVNFFRKLFCVHGELVKVISGKMRRSKFELKFY